jgi:hypothetical protein
MYFQRKNIRRRDGEREGGGWGGALASPLKRILVIVALVIYKTFL